MKKIIMLMLAFAAFTSATIQAQSVLDKAKTAAAALDVLPIGNVKETAGSILGALSPKLSLSQAQSPKVLSLLTTFLQSKSGILGLAKSDPAGYTSKFSGISSKLMSGLKTALTVSQYKSLLGLKPKTNDASNVLSHLFF